MKTISLPSKIVAITLATLLALMGILPFIGSSKAFAEDAELERARVEITVESNVQGQDYIGTVFTGSEIYAQNLIVVTNDYGNEYAYKSDVPEEQDGDYIYTLSGNVSGTNWGHYTGVEVTAYHWSTSKSKYTKDNTASFNWWITRMYIPVPTAAEGLVYNGTEQVGVAEGTGYELTGVAAATDAGEYVAVASLINGNYKWLEANDAEVTAVQTEASLEAELAAFNPDPQEIEWSIEQNTELAIVNGDVKWVKGSKDGATLSTNGVKGECESITISNENGWTKPLYNDEEGSLVEGITVEDGSTILVADAAVLESLATGKYTVTFEYNNDNYDPSTVETTLTVAEPTVAKTGDSAGLIALAGLALVAAAGACVVLSMRRRQN